VVRGHLRDVHEAFDALAHLDEGAEGHEFGDATVDQLVDGVAVGEDLPGVGLGGLERQEMRSLEKSTSSTSTSTSSPTATTWLGWSMCFQESSET
jgi:hypothetical protein